MQSHFSQVQLLPLGKERLEFLRGREDSLTCKHQRTGGLIHKSSVWVTHSPHLIHSFVCSVTRTYSQDVIHYILTFWTRPGYFLIIASLHTFGTWVLWSQWPQFCPTGAMCGQLLLLLHRTSACGHSTDIYLRPVIVGLPVHSPFSSFSYSLVSQFIASLCVYVSVSVCLHEPCAIPQACTALLLIPARTGKCVNEWVCMYHGFTGTHKYLVGNAEVDFQPTSTLILMPWQPATTAWQVRHWP